MLGWTKQVLCWGRATLDYVVRGASSEEVTLGVSYPKICGGAVWQGPDVGGGECGHTWQAFQLWNSARRHEMPSEGLGHVAAGSDFCFRTVSPTAVQRMWVISGQGGDH